MAWLFSHGQLQIEPPESAGGMKPARIRGRLFGIAGGTDTALVDVGDPKAPWVRGHAMEIDGRQWSSLDRLERHADDERVGAVTEEGQKVQVYQYKDGQLPKDAEPIGQWFRKGTPRALELGDLPHMARPGGLNHSAAGLDEQGPDGRR